MHTQAGINADGICWLLYAAFAGLWLWSLRLSPLWRQLRFQALPMSFFGYIWIGFGINYIIRFPLLCWDSFIVGNMTSRLQDAAPQHIVVALLLSILFYVCFVGGYAVGVRF